MKKKMLVALFAVMSVATASAYTITIERLDWSPTMVRVTTLPFKKTLVLQTRNVKKTTIEIPNHWIASQLKIEMSNDLRITPSGSRRPFTWRIEDTKIINMPPNLVGKNIFVSVGAPELRKSGPWDVKISPTSTRKK